VRELLVYAELGRKQGMRWRLNQVPTGLEAGRASTLETSKTGPLPLRSTAFPSGAERHEIRVFISTTVGDMQEEREELVKQVFPHLRSLCESRGVTWGEVDLRWGVSDEAKAEGKVLPLCLAEIERRRPYFIGLLGERCDRLA